MLHHLQAAGRLLRRNPDGGSVVLLSSALARQGIAGNTVYAASKAAIEGAVAAAARELGPLGIRVNAVAPGFVATDLTAALSDAHRAAMADAAALPWPVTAEDVAAAIGFLLSPAARCITGQVLGVDAGLRPR
ncbi:MAG: SDR family oxidoreductase [Deltaproteobacteria bacterium]|nr:MAG: SDR family oxidoreductase [Deltaproteobacteria bacterium]